MKRFLLALLAVAVFALPGFAQTETWNLDPPHSAAHFAVRHLGISTVRGAFSKVSGTVQYDPAHPEQTVVDVTIDANSVDTRVEMRDKDLRSPNFFDVEKYPTITFKSKKVEASGSGKLNITGDLTIHGVTKEVVLHAEGPSGPIKDPRGNQHMGATASTEVNRKDFGVNGAPGGVGDNITITLDVEMVKPATPSAK
jgi:polyisoprenoid-binding protein YceI